MSKAPSSWMSPVGNDRTQVTLRRWNYPWLLSIYIYIYIYI